MHKSTCVVLAVACCLAAASCSSKKEYGKKTYPVTGELYVDGAPAEGVQVTFHNVNKDPDPNFTASTAFTDAQGKFAASTFELGDGAPEGEYTVTFFWGTLNLLTMQFGGPDKLKDKYSDPDKSEFRVKVEPDKPADMGRIELTTK